MYLMMPGCKVTGPRGLEGEKKGGTERQNKHTEDVLTQSGGEGTEEELAIWS